jgi:hypothetical protein
MRARTLALILSLTLLLSGFAAGCGSTSSSHHGHHALLKSVAGAVIVHHVLKKHHSKHALLKSVAAGGVIHHFVKKK